MFGDMKAFPGFVSADVIPPANEGGAYQVVTKFDTEADLRRWDQSDAHGDWLNRTDTVAEGSPAYRVITGLEAWFAPEVVPASIHPPRWRMTLASLARHLPDGEPVPLVPRPAARLPALPCPHRGADRPHRLHHELCRDAAPRPLAEAVA